MRKTIVVVMLALLVLSGAAWAQNVGSGLEPLMAPKDLAVTAGIGYGLFWGAIDVSGGVEYMLGQFTIADTLPLTYGAAVKASYYRYSYSWGDYHWSYLGAGVFGTLHLGLKDLNLPDNLGWLANVDTYVGLGAGLFSYSDSYYTSQDGFRLGLRSVGGFNYFLSPRFAINVEGGYYGGWGGGLLGVLVKI